MTANEHIEYMASLEAGSFMMHASTGQDYVQYLARDNKTLSYPPFLPPNCSLYPVDELLQDTYPLLQFQKLVSDLEKHIGQNYDNDILKLWTFAYYAGIPDFTSSNVYMLYDGATFTMPPLFNYEGAFCSPCEYEELRPPERAFQVHWYYFSQNLKFLHEEPPYIRNAIAHFTELKFYR